MQTFKNCICVAQARVIAGRKKDSHICTIAFQPEESRFLRLCIPYIPGRSPLLKRWVLFNFEGTKEALPNIDTREESWNAVNISKIDLVKSETDKKQIHKILLSTFKHESDLNNNRESIGILIPEPKSLSFYHRHYSPHNPDDLKKLSHLDLMANKGIWFPSYEIRVKGSIKGKYRSDRRLVSFDKQLLAWDVYEACRTISKGVDPYQSIYNYRNPYMIIGNTPRQRNAFMVIGILSAPKGMIEKYALTQQLLLC